MFEILKTDLAGRIGRLETNHGTVNTPAYVPVLHPARQSIPASEFRKIGFDIIITNAYLARKNSKGAARDIHDTVQFDGPIMTDSGGYQILEYGDLDVSPQEMAEYETAIGTDIAVPLDKPTGFGLPRETAERYVKETLRASKDTIKSRPDNGQIWMGPIQGGEHADLVSESVRALQKYGFKMLALGSPVEFMESYRYRLLAEMIISARKAMRPGMPLHLFGAGHPLTIPLAVALGCDTFDSASYVLYAKQKRYITEDGTRSIDDIEYFSCSCPICSNNTPRDIAESEPQKRTDLISVHNLYAIKSEVDRTKEAIHRGRLWEHVVKKARAHPRLWETVPVMTKERAYLAGATPRFKKNAIFLIGAEDQYRPEVAAYHCTVRRFRTRKKRLCIFSDADIKPAYLSSQYESAKLEDPGAQHAAFNPFLGIIPVELSDMYPAAHYIMSNVRRAPQDFEITRETVKIFFENNHFDLVLVQDNSFLKWMMRGIKCTIRKKKKE